MREVKRVNRKVLVVFVGLIGLAMLATPVLAIGPQNAVGNPNIVVLGYGVGLDLPSGLSQQWIPANNKHLMIKDAREFQINNAWVVTDISQVAGMENKWVFFSVPMFAQWMAFHVQIPYPAALAFVTAHWPQGVYYREVFVGQ